MLTKESLRQSLREQHAEYFAARREGQLPPKKDNKSKGGKKKENKKNNKKDKRDADKQGKDDDDSGDSDDDGDDYNKVARVKPKGRVSNSASSGVGVGSSLLRRSQRYVTSDMHFA